MNNPFNPEKVKLFNYHPEQIEQNKIENIHNKMSAVNGKSHEYQQGYKPKSYGDVLKKPDSYSNHLPQKPSYGDAMNRNNNGFKNN